MQLFLDLASQVRTRWAAEGNDLSRFPEVATAALNDFRYSLPLAKLESELSAWLLSHPELPEQINVHNTFGQPPVTVFHGGSFVVDLYFWTGFDTSAHSHGFRGAFKVLHGRSLEEVFAIHPLKTVAPDVLICEPVAPQCSVLDTGAIRTIGPGFELSHRVIHLDNPTVTLCVKTIGEPALPQWHHYSNGLAIQKRQIGPGLVKKIYYYQYLAGREAGPAAEFLKSLIASLDISTAMNLCEDVSGGALELNDEAAQAVLDEAYHLYGSQEWFGLYEAAGADAASALDFSGSTSALVRLAAHFFNTGQFGKPETQPLFDKIAGRPLDPAQMAELFNDVRRLNSNE